ncbi:hydrolase, TatD family [Thiovulum sp. ES]|nr:hydrolase, TatD family [Thiovulum sp. ES]
MLIDTHVHLDNEKFEKDYNEMFKRAIDGGVEKFIIPGADPKDLVKAIELSKNESVFFAVGVHPYHIDDWDETIFEKVSNPKCVAVGECGLDYFRLPEDKVEKEKVIEKQKEIFRKQIRIAKKFKKPIIVHIREASEDAKQILLEENGDEVGGVLHCYNADRTLLDLADSNFYFGIGGVVTFKNGKRLQAVLPDIPREKLLLETDAPYLTPHPHRGERNEPFYTTFIAEKVAELLNENIETITNLTTKNSEEIFKFHE